MKKRNLDILLKVRLAHEGQAMAALGTERRIVSDLSHDLQEATSNLARLMVRGRRGVEQTKTIAAQRSSAAARVRLINDALYLAHMRAENARQAWIVADREREIGQRLVDQDAQDRETARDRAERHEADDRARGRLVIRGVDALEQGDDA